MTTRRKFLIASSASITLSLFLSYNSKVKYDFLASLPKLPFVNKSDKFVNSSQKKKFTDELNMLLDSGLSNEDIWELIKNKIQSDYYHDRVEIIDGWLITNTEIILESVREQYVFKFF